MRPVTRYSLAGSRNLNQRVLLKRDGNVLPVEVEGVILEAQFGLNDGSTLIWLTDNSPYDEGLHIYLLRQDDTIEDALEAGAIFGLGEGGILKITKTNTDWVEFTFFLNDRVYRLYVTEQARVHLRLPTGWRYKKLLSKHRLIVRELKEGGK